MTNAFYNPSGNPASGAEGLSALMRAEFISIGVAFDLMPAITTTGLFATVFNQQGSYTFTLPGAPGTLATLTDVGAETTRATAAEGVNATAVVTERTRATAAEGVNATAISTETTARTTAVTAETNRATAAEGVNATAVVTERTRATAAEGVNATAISTETTARTTAVTAETNRATAAEGVNATAISAETTRATAAEASKQPSLGFTPVQQGGGAGQGTNKVYIGWDGTNNVPRIQIDTTDMGAIATQSWVLFNLFGTVHNVVASRAPGTSYTNTTGKPMFVTVSAISSSAVLSLLMTVDGVVTGSATSPVSSWANVTGIVPSGKSYVFTVGSFSGLNWSETW